ncbi:MAG: kynureninase [Candidatus Kariarchaeaceae archaeon]|jgi:kynureninase
MKFEVGEDFSKQLDSQDSLALYRERFYMPQHDGKDAIYLNGNSLGLQPKRAKQFIDKELEDWQLHGVEGHFTTDTPWVKYPELTTESIAKLVGAKPVEVVTMNTLSVNMHLLFVSFYRPTPKRYKILIEYSAFPSDQYAVKSQIKFHGFDLDDALIEIQPREGEEIVRDEDLYELIKTEGEEIALIWIGNPNYYTGQVYDMLEITKLGHEMGCIVGFDLAHGVGNILLELHAWDVDFAVWCNYKYLNGGPGSIGGGFINERYANARDLPRFAGWWGQNKERKFLMEPDFDPIVGAEGWQLSTPPIFSIAPLRASLEIFDEVGMQALREKSILMVNYLLYLLSLLPGDRISIITPQDHEKRGCQLSITVSENGKAVHQQLLASGVICDWREPNVIRIAPTPLYNTFHECFQFVEIIKNQFKE